MKKCLKTFFLFCWFFAFFKPLCAEETIFIDMRLLISAHPLYSAFDTKTNRFKGTSSEFIEGGWDGVQAEIEKIKKKQDELLKYPDLIKEKLKPLPITDRLREEKTLLGKKRVLENELQNLKMRVHMARQFPTMMGKTLDTAIFPQVNQIVSDMRSVVIELKKKYNAKNIIDTTDLLPYSFYSNKRSQLLVSNLHKQLYSENCDIDSKKIQKWLKEASEFWLQNFGVDSNVIPYGALDVRLEALKMLDERVRLAK